jgi:hypothetical protein
MKTILKILSFTLLSAMFAVMLWFLNSVSTNVEPQNPPCSIPAEIIRVVMDGVEFAIPHEYQPSFDVDSWRGKKKPVQHIFYNPDKTIRLGYCQTAEEPAFDLDYIHFPMKNLKNNPKYFNNIREQFDAKILKKVSSISLNHSNHIIQKEYDWNVYESFQLIKIFNEPVKLVCNKQISFNARSCDWYFNFPQNIYARINLYFIQEQETDPIRRKVFLHENQKELVVKEIIKFVNSIIVKKENKL